MKSKTSCFNSGVAKNLLQRYWPLWLGNALLLSLLPLSLYSRLRSFDPAVSLSPGLDFALGGSCELLLFLSLFMGIATAMAVFGFLYNSRQCGLMNSLPLTRTCLFFTAFLTGGLALLAADVLVFGLTALLCPSGYLSMATVLNVFAATVFSKLFFYGFAVFCAMLTGSLLILPCVNLVLNFTAIVAEVCTRDVLSKVIFGLSANDMHLSILCPFIQMMKKLGTVYTQWPSQVVVNGVSTTAVYALVGLAFVFCAWRLFLRRQMETACDVVAIRVLKPVFQYCMCFGCALVLAALLYEFIDLRLSGRSAALFLIFLLLLGAFFGYFAARMLIDKTLRVFHGHWKGYLISAALIAALICACEWDLFGVERMIPAAEEVELVAFDGVELRDRESIEGVIALQESLIANKDKHERVKGPGIEYLSVSEEGTAISRVVNITYILKSGRTLTRSYAVRGDERDIADPNSDIRRLEALMNCQEALAYRCTFQYPVTAETVVNASLELLRTDNWHRDANGKPYYNYYTDSVSLTPDELLDFWENGVMPDLAEGHIARRTICDAERSWAYTSAELYVCLVRDREVYQRAGGLVSEQQWINIQVATDSVHCLDWIEAHTGFRPTAEEGVS